MNTQPRPKIEREGPHVKMRKRIKSEFYEEPCRGVCTTVHFLSSGFDPERVCELVTNEIQRQAERARKMFAGSNLLELS
ncbi:Hypothetical protein NTJ_14695 [Nesidiocoris tenuis]|uniref:Uncharacterized protein n=1 Tax=Nesidiocoris tenuis TaxID=355587 RepID=A0ABN7BBX9_9HEMI|nr:Hypothetical protein NTJ_14695 [Nesidiocoris tenuis]